MRVLSWVIILALAVSLAPGQPAGAGLAPVSISVAAPLEPHHNPHVALGIPHHSWVVASAAVTVGADGSVSDVDMESIVVAALNSRTGAFHPLQEALTSEDSLLFEDAARSAIQGARFERKGGAPRRTSVTLAWKAYGGSMDMGAVQADGILRHAPGVLVRTFEKGTTLYLWRGADAEVDAGSLAIADHDDRPAVLGLPSRAFAERMAPDCPVLESAPRGVFGQNLDDGLRPVEPLGALDYPETERREGVHGIVMLLVSVGADGSVTGVYPAHTTPGHPAFAESAIRSVCRLEFNEPRREGEPVAGLHWQHAEFTAGP